MYSGFKIKEIGARGYPKEATRSEDEKRVYPSNSIPRLHLDNIMAWLVCLVWFNFQMISPSYCALLHVATQSTFLAS